MVREINHRLASLNRELGNGLRIEILDYLQESEEAYLKEIANHVERTASTMSGHMKTLTDYNLVRSETRGRRKYFRLKRPDLVHAYLNIRSLLRRNADNETFN